MSLFRLLWLRRFIRKNTKPIPINTAEIWKKRLTYTYFFFAWNAFGFVCYMCFTGKADWVKHYGLKSDLEANMPAGQSWAQTLGINKVTVVQVSGLLPKNTYEVVDGEIIEPNKTETKLTT